MSKYLVCTANNSVYLYTDALAKRPSMRKLSNEEVEVYDKWVSLRQTLPADKCPKQPNFSDQSIVLDVPMGLEPESVAELPAGIVFDSMPDEPSEIPLKVVSTEVSDEDTSDLEDLLGVAND